ncbi:hypothetical protein GW796_00320 [archaeon]|nr:hypothetical protein [archaeon]
MKKIIILLSIYLSSIAFAQIDIGLPGKSVSENNPIKMEVARKNTEYSGAIVGFAKSCNLPESEYNKIGVLLFKNLNTVGLTEIESIQMKSVFENSIKSAQERGSKNTKTECNLFTIEFNKIISAISSPAN